MRHQDHAETAIDNLVAARNAAHKAGDRRAADAYTTAIQKISRVTDCITPAPQLVAELAGHPGIAAISGTDTGTATVDYTDGSRITITETAGHGHEATLDGRRHEWTTTGPAALASGSLIDETIAYADLPLRHDLEHAADNALVN